MNGERRMIVLAVALILVIIIGGFAYLALSGGLWGDQPPSSTGTGDAGRPEFITDVIATGKDLVFLVIPRSPTVSRYTVSYSVAENGNIIDSVSSRIYSNISKSQPILVSIPQSPGFNYTFTVFVEKDGGGTAFSKVVTFTGKPLG